MNISVGQYIFQANFSTFFISFIMLFFCFTNRIIHKRQLAFFGTAFIFILVCGILESLIFSNSFEPLPPLFTTFCAALLFSFWPAILCFILEIASTSKPVKRTQRFVYYLPMFLNLVLCLISCTNGMIFSFDENNHFTTGPIWFFPIIIEAFYLALLIWNTSWHFKTNVWDSITALFIIVVTILSVTLQITLKQNFLITTSLCMALTFYFLSMNVQFYRHDSLTQLHNRKSFLLDLMKLSNAKVTILTAKIENLNVFFDTAGIDGGNMAILTTVKRMEDYFEKLGRIYRVANDRFKVLFVNTDINAIQKKLDEFTNEMSKTQYTITCKLENHRSRL